MFHKALKVVDTFLQSFSEVATSVPQKGGSKLSTSKELSTTYEPCRFQHNKWLSEFLKAIVVSKKVEFQVKLLIFINFN